MAGFFGGGGMGNQPQQQPTQGTSMMQIVDEYRNRYSPFVMESGRDPITGTDKPADIQTFIKWRQQNPGPWN